jgi:monoamine oxidase
MLAGCRVPLTDGDPEADLLGSLPDLGIPQPTAYLRTNWSRDPFSLCSYSSLPPSRPGARARVMLAEPVDDRLFFAGEATSTGSPAMVHGALESGLRAARQVEGARPAGARVTVVGAGAAGLACARVLLDSGFEVTVIEGRERIGGRVWTEEIGGVPAEMGASWIHGQRGNPLTALADRFAVERIPFAYETTFPLPDQARAGAAGRRQLNRGLDSFNPRRADSATTPIADLLPRRRTPGLEWAIDSEIAQEYGADPEQLSVMATEEGDWLRGGDALLGGSYAELVRQAAGELPILTGVTVEKIDWGRDRVEVSAGGGGTYISDLAVVTVPIGVLKAGSIRFAPGLPADKLRAIAGLGSGLLDKLWLSFDEPFWDRDAEMLAWIDPERPGRWAEWVNGYRAFGRPVLLGFNGGDEALRLAGRDDRTVVESGIRALAGMYGRG